MDPTATLMERAATEWRFLLANVPSVALWAALGFALLLVSAILLTALLPLREYPAAGAHGSGSREAMRPVRVTVPPARTRITAAATLPAEVARSTTAPFSTDETAAPVALPRLVRPPARRHRAAGRPITPSELADDPRRIVPTDRIASIDARRRCRRAPAR